MPTTLRFALGTRRGVRVRSALISCCLLLFSGSVFGQAIIQYGHGVAKAGAAGAASGTGIAGIFSQLKNTTDGKDGKSQPATAAAVAARTDPANTDTASSGPASDAANGPLKLTTSSGVVVSGVAPTWLGASYQDSVTEPVRVRKVEWANAEEEKAARLEREVAASMASARAGDVVTVEDSAADTDAPATVAGAAGVSRNVPASDANDGAQPAPVTDAETAGIRNGAPIAEVIQVLGRPSFSLTGIAGKSYSEKYVFRKNGIGTVTVLCWAGVVNSVSVTP